MESKGGVVIGALSPHPPALIPGVGDYLSRAEATRDGLRKMADAVASAKPDTVFIVAPHPFVAREVIVVMGSPVLDGGFAEFGVSGNLRFENDLDLVRTITKLVPEYEVPAVALDNFPPPHRLHYAFLVPLYYLHQAGFDGRLAGAVCGLPQTGELLSFGRLVRAAAGQLGRRVAFVASGDLSHCLTKDAPEPYNPMGEVFDEKIVEAVDQADIEALRNLDPDLLEQGAQCGYNPILTLFGATEGLEPEAQVLSYEGPFGVGYCVAVVRPGTGSAG